MNPKISFYLKLKAFVTLYTIPFKNLESDIFFGGGGIEINTFIYKGCFKLIKSDVKDIL